MPIECFAYFSFDFDKGLGSCVRIPRSSIILPVENSSQPFTLRQTTWLSTRIAPVLQDSKEIVHAPNDRLSIERDTSQCTKHHAIMLVLSNPAKLHNPTTIVIRPSFGHSCRFNFASSKPNIVEKRSIETNTDACSVTKILVQTY